MSLGGSGGTAGRGTRRHVAGATGLSILLMGLFFGPLGCGPRVPDPITLVPGRPTPIGLRRVETDETGVVFVRPGVQMSDYSELIVDPFMLSYTSERDPGDESVRMLDPETEERFKKVVHRAFVNRMRYSEGFELVDRPGPSALRVQGWLYDLIVEEPPTRDSRNFPLCFAEVTIVLTIRDSQTARPIAEVGDRTQLTCPMNPEGFASTTWTSVGKGVDVWAKRLRRWLEDLHALPPIEG